MSLGGIVSGKKIKNNNMKLELTKLSPLTSRSMHLIVIKYV